MAVLPERMRVIEVREPGSPRVLTLAERPLPRLAPGEVLIRVVAAGVNRPDVMQRQGQYPPPAGVTDIPGLEVAGEIVAVASASGGAQHPLQLGTAVCALLAGGGYAQYVAAPAAQCLPIPRALSMVEAAALPETFFTVYLNVFERAALAAGESLLVHGGSSGIGTTAILLAKAHGARVFATAGTARKCAACLALGADRAINYREEDFVAAVQDATYGKGVDVILDMVGGAYLGRDIAAAATEGRIALIALLGGARAELDLRPLLVKRLKLMAATLRPQSVEFKGRLARALESRVWPQFATGTLRAPPIHARFPLEEAWRAHELMESGEHIGKIVLEVAPAHPSGPE
ncbi:MAG TPA: NAD(P)H-quinone oxidoreductase [Steroidobacteraceae bacterium]|nr:NAD(P)H-quinone oxidoreductase [Steroidobacteraceae bacterium]